MNEIANSLISEIFMIVGTALAGLIGMLLSFGLKRLEEYLKVKLSKETYEHALEVARGLYVYLEDKYSGTFKSAGELKKVEMESILLEKFPSLTQTELDSINKAVWESFNSKFTITQTGVEKLNG